MTEHYDIIVVGGGHAGIEAAHAAARLGARTLLLTLDASALGRMSCNPAIGGLGKSHLVREIDALGGVIARAADATGIQFRTLNTGKGPAVQAPRCQSDKAEYVRWMRDFIDGVQNLTVSEAHVTALALDDNRVTGVIREDGRRLAAGAVVLTTGTFLDGLIHVGLNSRAGGRLGEPAARGLGASLAAAGLRTGRLKTGTPARLDGRTIDYTKCELQPGDPEPQPFSFRTEKIDCEQVPCHITHTRPETHEIILAHLDESPMFTGKIASVGPRYCPSIEDKCVRFEGRDSHQVFLEPEGRDTHSVYPGGISTSLPDRVQEEFVRTIPGLERVAFFSYGYAIEYTFAPPTQLDATLQAKTLPGLFLAGQINGTSGYEEAAGQGLLAGVNAVLHLRGAEPFVLGRDEAYLGVMVDDLITKGAEEPYRMFTSRAEYRLLLRCDNADLRLCERGHQLGLLPDDVYDRFRCYRDRIETELERLKTTVVRPSELDAEYLAREGLPGLDQAAPAAKLLTRPGAEYRHLIGLGLGRGDLEPRAAQQVEIAIRYEGYIRRQRQEIERAAALENRPLPAALDYGAVYGLTNEARGKLAAIRPRTLGQAARIPGVNPADITTILIHLKKNAPRANAELRIANSE